MNALQKQAEKHLLELTLSQIAQARQREEFIDLCIAVRAPFKEPETDFARGVVHACEALIARTKLLRK